jgi:Fe-S cluster assembly iron-binding protein IscA
VAAGILNAPETIMLEITESACKELDAFFEGKEKTPIRVYLTSGGCSGSRLALALDTPAESDAVFAEKGFSFIIDADLFAAAKGIKVDFTYMGFSVESEIPLVSPGGCSCCSGGCPA